MANSFLEESQLNDMEPFYPLRVYVCDRCFLVQAEQYATAEEIFKKYAYFSSYSETWLEHARSYCAMMVERFGLGTESHVVEIASNDGYLLQYFAARNIPVLGIEPAANIAEVAIRKGISTEVSFFNTETAARLAAAGKTADLLIGNNVLGHVPQIKDFVSAMRLLLKPSGIITMEFPHLLKLIAYNQFDTIYHEHFSYLSFLTVEQIFARRGLVIFDVQELPTHGGSLRIFARHLEDTSRPISAAVLKMRRFEAVAGLADRQTYLLFSERIKATKRKLLSFLISAKRKKKVVVGYGAPAKGNTLLNYCGIGSDFIDYTVDRSPEKQGRYLPGTHIPICDPARIRETRPDYVLVLPWNLIDEITEQMADIREWRGRFVVPIPEPKLR